MGELINKSALVAEIKRIIDSENENIKSFEQHRNISEKQRYNARMALLEHILSFLDTIEVKEVEENKLPNPRFPHLNNIVDKVFGTGNLESWEYDEAEQLVLLAKEELLKDLEVKEVEEVDLEKEVRSQMDLLSNLLCYMDELSNGDSEGIFPLPEKVMEDLQRFGKYFFELGLNAKKSTVCRNTCRRY